jgi:hypothetical protein
MTHMTQQAMKHLRKDLHSKRLSLMESAQLFTLMRLLLQERKQQIVLGREV